MNLRTPLAALALALMTSHALAQSSNRTDPANGAIANPFSDIQSLPFLGAVAMTVGTPGYATQRSIGANCTVAGSMTVTLSDASTIVLPLGVGWQTFPFAASEVNSSTATCTYSNLK